MSIYTGRMGSPPKRHWYQTREGETLLIVSAIVAVGLLAAIWYMLATPAVLTEISTVPAANASLEQRRGEWNPNQSALSPAQRAFYEQRMGEWTEGQVRIPPVLPMQIDPAWQSRMAEALGAGVR